MFCTPFVHVTKARKGGDVVLVFNWHLLQFGIVFHLSFLLQCKKWPLPQLIFYYIFSVSWLFCESNSTKTKYLLIKIIPNLLYSFTQEYNNSFLLRLSILFRSIQNMINIQSSDSYAFKRSEAIPPFLAIFIMNGIFYSNSRNNESTQDIQ